MASRWLRPVICLLDLRETAAVLCGLLQKMAPTYSHVLSTYPHINGKEPTGLPRGCSLGSGGRKTGHCGVFLSFFFFFFSFNDENTSLSYAKPVNANVSFPLCFEFAPGHFTVKQYEC